MWSSGKQFLYGQSDDIKVDIWLESDRIMGVNEWGGLDTRSDVYNKRSSKIRAKSMNNRRNKVEPSVSRLMYEGWGLGTKGNEVEVESKWYEVSQRWGEQSTMLLCVKWECYVNISKNNPGEVEMASEGSDTTNSL